MATDAKETKHDTHLEVTVSKGTERRRQGKFQPFKRLFGKRKKRGEVERGFHAAELKASYSTGEVCNGVVSDDEDTNQNLRELNPIGSRALSHDSIFIPEDPEAEPCLEQTMSQENVSDKVRNLQRQIAQSIKFGQKPPSLRRSEGDEGSSDEEEEVPQSPLKVLAQMEAAPAEPQPKQEGQAAQQQQHVHESQQAQVQGAQQVQPPAQHSTPVRSPRSRRVITPDGTIESINLDSVPLAAPRLDNTAAKHKLSVKPKNQRVSRKHRRFTQDLQGVSLPGVLQEEQEAEGGQQRTAAEEPPPYGSPETSKKQRLQEEERRRREQELQRLRREEEEERRRRAEELRVARELEEERCRRLQEEERLRKEEEERRQREEEAERMRREEEERTRREEERRRQEEQERRRREEEEAARRRREEEERRRIEEEERKRLEEQRRKEEEERKRREEEEKKRREAEEEERRRTELEDNRLREEEERQRRLKEEMEVKVKLEAEERRKMEEEEQKPPQERKRRAEELRWREMEERQKPFSFKVSSSGEKQILFQKVNLTPVSAASSVHHGGPAAAEPAEGVKTSSSSEAGDTHLPSSQYVPHTAILVTGAQLCGTAVQMDQIKDTACKSLLGLGEDKRAMGSPLANKGNKVSPDRKSAKTKSLTEASGPATDQSSAAVLAEWASIRSKIFKGAEEGKYDEYQEPGRNQTRPSSEDLNQPPFPHSNLRKTMSANAKFSITPAKKKFGDSNRNSELLNVDVREGEKDGSPHEAPCSSPSASPGPGGRAQSKAAKTVRIAERGSEECMFAKDLPSFLVPNPGSKAEVAEVKNGSQGEAADSDYNEEEEEEERGGEGGEDKPSPFGIKLRRTNYSLRFHSEQSTEKRKKRYSAGDSFDGVPSPLTPIEPDSDCSSVFSDKSSPVSPHPESAGSRLSHAAASPAVLRAKSGRSQSATSSMHGEGEKALSKPLLYQRPAVLPKPATPPPSPLPKTVRASTTQRVGGPAESPGQDEESCSAVAQLRRSSHVAMDEEPKEKKSFFPSINIPWREKTDRKTELLRKDKPSLQSRHSLDSSRASEKEVGPLWITLALQKQKGFREQQQSRDDRRSQREAKLAEKQSREKDGATLGSPTDSKVDRSPSPSKARTPEEPKRPDSLLGRFDRRDPLKKANTLPSSVTVEIADSTPSPPSVKEVSKRFPSTDSPLGSTEPAWLALAKRKAKAWSDCPQIIK